MTAVDRQNQDRDGWLLYQTLPTCQIVTEDDLVHFLTWYRLSLGELSVYQANDIDDPLPTHTAVRQEAKTSFRRKTSDLLVNVSAKTV